MTCLPIPSPPARRSTLERSGARLGEGERESDGIHFVTPPVLNPQPCGARLAKLSSIFSISIDAFTHWTINYKTLR